MTIFKVGDVVYVKEEKWGLSGPNVIEAVEVYDTYVYYKLKHHDNWWTVSKLAYNEPIRNYDETNKLAKKCLREWVRKEFGTLKPEGMTEDDFAKLEEEALDVALKARDTTSTKTPPSEVSPKSLIKESIDLAKARRTASELAEKYLQKYQDSVSVDVVNAPSHYMIIGNTEAKDLINVMLEQYVKDTPTATPYQIFCAGNVFKYRLRAGSKDSVTQEIDKAKKYKEMHDIINSRK